MAGIRALGTTRLVVAGLAVVAALGLWFLLRAPAASADEPTTGTVTIVLDASPNDAQDFPFTGCQGQVCGPFTLDDDTNGTLASSLTVTDLPPATYTITQAAVPNWSLASLTCDTGETVSLPNRRATVQLTAGEHVTCTFTNTSASITIIENVAGGDPHDFTFTGCQGSGCATFVLDDDDDPTHPDRVSAAGLAPATYVITQDADAPWPIFSISCTRGAHAVRAEGRVTITLAAGQSVTCSFTNQTQSLTIIEDALPDDAQVFSFRGCHGTGCGTFTLDDTGETPLARAITGRELPPGTYVVTQDPAPGYELAAVWCGTNEETDVLRAEATVQLAPGEQATCTFTNRRPRAPLTGVTQISAGRDHTCALLTDGGARCWGRNVDYGQLGDGTFDDAPSPVVVRDADGAVDDATQVVAGFENSCMVTTRREARCWGADDHGQLGDGAVEPDAARPVTVLDGTGAAPLEDVSEVSVHGAFACARTADEHAWCWGWRGSGHLGDGHTSGDAPAPAWADQPLPVAVQDTTGSGALEGVAQITTGLIHACARLTNGEARCWGANYDGRLGDGTITHRTRPAVVLDPSGSGPLTGISSIDAGESHTCALLVSTDVVCWGADDWYELGTGAGIDQPVAVAVSNAAGTGPLTGVVQISAGDQHTCALLVGGEAQCWGRADHGQLGAGSRLGDPDHNLRSRPVTVRNETDTGPLTGIAEISAGGMHTCARLDNGEARCWGSNWQGPLGDGTSETISRLPRVVVAPEP